MPSYQKTITIQNERELDGLHIGQWFQLGTHGIKGQYLGTTRAGCDVVRYGKFGKMNAMRNMLQRTYAKQNGAN